MFAADTYRIRIATDQDTDTLGRLAEQHSQQPLDGRVLIGEIDGVGAAARSLTDGRVIADHSPRIDHVVANLRVRAVSIWTYGATPSLSDRLLAGLPAWYRAIAVRSSAPDEERVEREPVLVGR
jgi:hypothetical protein